MDNFEIFVECGHDVVHLEESKSNVARNSLLMRGTQVSPVEPHLLVFLAADFLMEKLLPKVGKRGSGYASWANWLASGALLIDECGGYKPGICVSLIKNRKILPCAIDTDFE